MSKKLETCNACGSRFFLALDDYADKCPSCCESGGAMATIEDKKSEKKLLGATELLKKVEYGNPGETSLETCNVLHYESGDVTKNLFYAKIYPEKRKYHKIEAKIAMSDLLAQCNVICDREGWDFKEVHEMGITRLKERIDRRMKLRE